MIQLASEQVEPGAAIILGAGPCQEIPLPALTERFASVTLNDWNESSLEQVAVSPERSSKVLRLVADLTGVTTQFLEQVTESLATTDDPEQAIEKISALADAVTPQVFSTGQSYDLVVASCVLCQLHLEACNQALALFGATFPQQVQQFRASTRWVQAMYGLARRMERAFIETVHGLVASKGRIYLSETIQGCFIHLNPEGHWMTDGMYRMTHTLELSDYLDARFHVEEFGKWVWVMPPSSELGFVGRLYKVQGFILSIK
ncbi:hypothetical protein SAMN05444166_7048 [Singulisphaera sp. GP187]|nr:hypothetical protein SAMN05444166_7048 [Singulisphaera sp. GP187]